MSNRINEEGPTPGGRSGQEKGSMDHGSNTVLGNSGIIRYDRRMPGQLQREYYGGSGFYNFGYWTPETGNQREASESLVRKLLALMPEKQGKILDVACGMGATTEMLLVHYLAENIYGVNISPNQLSLARQRVPDSSFIAMDAAHLGFTDESFENIICVEAAFHFTTRTDFLQEAYRVLKPGGRLVHSDILHRYLRSGRKANFLADPGALASSLESIGFVEVEVQDRTQECFRGFVNNIKAWPGQERRAGRMGFFRYLGLTVLSRVFTTFLNWRIRYYLLSSARKPQT